MAERPEGSGFDGVEPGRQDDHADQVTNRQDEVSAGNTADETTASSERTDAAGTSAPAEAGDAETQNAEADSAEDTERLSPGAGGEPTAEVLPLNPEVMADSDAARDDDLVDADELEEPVDLAEIQADDALLDALGGTDPSVPGESEDSGPRLEALLVSWRREVDAAPIADLVDVDTAAAAIAEGRNAHRRARRWRRHLVPVASAAAVLMILSTGVGLAARDALPGDMLWGVARVLYSDHARAAEAHEQAKLELQRAQQAWVNGNLAEAEGYLDSAQKHMRDVDDEHGLSSLEATHESLAAEFGKDENPPPDSSTSVASSEQPTESSELPTSTSETIPSETDTSIPTSTEDPTESSSYPTETTSSTSESSSGTSLRESGFPVPTP